MKYTQSEIDQMSRAAALKVVAELQEQVNSDRRNAMLGLVQAGIPAIVEMDIATQRQYYAPMQPSDLASNACDLAEAVMFEIDVRAAAANKQTKEWEQASE